MAMKLNLDNPAMEYRPIPFWSWNEKLDPEELRKQVRAMYDAGIGGFFMHACGAEARPECDRHENALSSTAGTLWFAGKSGKI